MRTKAALQYPSGLEDSRLSLLRGISKSHGRPQFEGHHIGVGFADRDIQDGGFHISDGVLHERAARGRFFSSLFDGIEEFFGEVGILALIIETVAGSTG